MAPPTGKERQRTKLNKINQNKIDKGQARLEELQAKEGTAGEYGASLQIPTVKEGILKARNAISPEYEDPNYEKSWQEDVAGYNLYAEGADKYNQDPVTNENFEERKALENPWSVESLQAQGIVGGGNEVAMQNDRTIFLRSEKAKINQQRAKEDLEFKHVAHAWQGVNKGTGDNYSSDIQASLNHEDTDIVDFENTGTGKHWKDMSQWERLQAKVKARGNPMETAKLKMQQSTFGTPSKVTQWYDLEGEDGGAAAKAEWKKRNQPEQQNVSNATSNDGKGGEIFTPAGESASDDDKNDLFGKSIIGT